MKFKTIQICGKTYKLIPESKEINEKACGHTDDMKQEIRYWIEQGEEQLRDTIVHEVIHAIDYATQLGFKERQVHVLATMLYNFMVSNPEFMKWLLAKK